MRRLINEAMDGGVIGLWMSVMDTEGNSHLDCYGSPLPSDLADNETILAICRALAERGGAVIQILSHLIIYGDRILTERLLEVTRGSGITVIHNAMMISGIMPDKSRRGPSVDRWPARAG